MNAPSLDWTSAVAIINAWHSQGLRTLGHGQTLSRTHSWSKQPVLNTTRALPSIVFVIYDCSGGAWPVPILAHEGSRISLTSSRPRLIWIWVSLTNAEQPTTSIITTPGCPMLVLGLDMVIPSSEFYHQTPLTVPLTLCFLTFHRDKPRCLKLDIQSSVMIMTECNWIKIQGLPCSNCEATSRQDNKCLF